MYTTEIDVVEDGKLRNIELLKNCEEVGKTPNGDRNVRVTTTTMEAMLKFLANNGYDADAQDFNMIPDKLEQDPEALQSDRTQHE